MRYTQTLALHGSLSSITANLPAALQQALGQGSGLPRRCFLPQPADRGLFILPLKQSFIRDARLMPGTRCMLALLTGWAGQGGALELTEGTIARHIGRSVRQVYRYLQDARREGYLHYVFTKDRRGLITGLKLWLSFQRLRAPRPTQAPAQPAPARTLRAEINEINKNTTAKNEIPERVLRRH